jgi:HSP20 family protein
MANIVRRQPEEEQRWPALTTWDPFRMMRDMLRWDPFRETSAFLAPTFEPAAFTPCFDVTETREGYVLKADLPGIDEKDLKITLTANRLTVAGKRETEEKKEGEHHYTVERSFGSFTRSFTLPSDVQGEKVHADLKNGVLTLMLPKKAEAKGKEIEIKIK